MILDFNPANQTYILRVPRDNGSSKLIQELMNEHGLDMSMAASTERECVLFTKEDYAAVSFFEHANDRAKDRLAALAGEIATSRQPFGTASSYAVPPDMELWDFQKGSIDYARNRTHVLIGDQPGLGKTPIAIALANEWRAQRVLLICPANIRLQWVRRIHEWSTLPWPRYIHAIMSGRNGVNPHAQWTVVSYDLARTPAIGAQLAAMSFDLLILDEAHYLKTIDARRTRAIFGGGERRDFTALADSAERVIALTGTPLPNRPRECYTMARGLCHEAIDWMSEDKFSERFNPSKKMEHVGADGQVKIWIDERTGRHAELQNRLRANFMVRHLKREVMGQLQMPAFDVIRLEPNKAVKLALQAESMLQIDPENWEGADMTVLGHISVVRRQMGIAMAPLVADYVNMLLDGGEEKIVLFAWHIEVLNILEKELSKHGTVRIDGSTSPKNKEALVQKFISDPRIQVIIGNLQSMGTGTDGLQLVSNHALIAEPSWTPGENTQAFDRLDRGGQTRTVQGDLLVAEGSLSEKILASALRKGQIIHGALDKTIEVW
jgi:SWI/SNF-related matrix-associated actin-dependent regulator 1 of chromatin subfamily A